MQKTKKAIIFGTGSFAELVHYFLNNDSEYEVVAFTVSKDQIEKDQFMSLPLVTFEEIETQYSPNDYEMYVAIGYNKMNTIRERFYKEAKQKGYTLLTYVSSYATVFTDKIGDNCFVFEDNTIQPFVEIGNNVVLWSGNHVGHHSKLGNHAWVCSHVVISGHCKIGNNCFIGVNATLRDSIELENKTLVGAGALLMKNTKEKQVYSLERTKPFKKNCDEIGF
ncbi:sugar O-acyltransferase [Candidatus Marinamargulisbacteria bacterium SCGC AG-333-B06]|nr:sugar O-acyltransferase [Candidatus Marinamargulisbacteria bacterium SCGC AG-333-B06]